ncbi:hypothetical protein T492DRAFT_1029565, partial [Pavlovales sp. CCMP2436]
MVQLLSLEPEPAPDPVVEQRSRRARALESLERAHGATLVAPVTPAPAGPARAQAGVGASAIYAALDEALASAHLCAARAPVACDRDDVFRYAKGLLVGELGRRGNAEEKASARIVESKLKGKAVLLDDPRVLRRNSRAKRRSGAQRVERPTLTRRMRREVEARAGPTSTPLQGASVVSQHRSWTAYAESAAGEMSRDEANQLARTLSRGLRGSPLEMHGAMLRVSRSRCPSYVGVSGILIEQSAHTVKLASVGFADESGRQQARTCTIPLRGSAFAVELSKGLAQALFARGVASLEVGSI